MVGYGKELLNERTARQQVEAGWSTRDSGKGASMQQPNEIGAMNGAVLSGGQEPKFETRGNSKEQDMNEAPENDAAANFGADLLVGGLLGAPAGMAMSAASAKDELEDAKAPRNTFVFKPAIAPQDPRKMRHAQPTSFTPHR